MSDSINWMGNKVFDPNVSRQYKNTAVSAPVQQNGTASPRIHVQQDYQPPEGVTQQGPPPSTDAGFIPYYLASNIGKNVRAEFIIGSNQYADKTGVLKEVGVNYFVLHDVNSRTDIMCDLYSVKFVTVLQYTP